MRRFPDFSKGDVMATILQMPRRKVEQDENRARILELWHQQLPRAVIAERLGTTVDTVKATISAARAAGVRRGDDLPPAPAPQVIEIPRGPLLRRLPDDWGAAGDAEILRSAGKYAPLARLSSKYQVETRVLLARWHLLRGAR